MYCQITLRLSISKERADTIVTKEIGVSDVSARQLSHLPIPEQKHARFSLSATHLELFEKDEEKVLVELSTKCVYITVIQKQKYHQRIRIIYLLLSENVQYHSFRWQSHGIRSGEFLRSYRSTKLKMVTSYARLIGLQHNWRTCLAIEWHYVE